MFPANPTRAKQGLFLRAGSFSQILVFLVIQTPNSSLGTGNVEIKDCSVSEIQFPDLSCAHRVKEIGKVSVSDHVGGKLGLSLVILVSKPAVGSWDLGSSINSLETWLQKQCVSLTSYVISLELILYLIVYCYPYITLTP